MQKFDALPTATVTNAKRLKVETLKRLLHFRRNRLARLQANKQKWCVQQRMLQTCRLPASVLQHWGGQRKTKRTEKRSKEKKKDRMKMQHLIAGVVLQDVF